MCTPIHPYTHMNDNSERPNGSNCMHTNDRAHERSNKADERRETQMKATKTTAIVWSEDGSEESDDQVNNE